MNIEKEQLEKIEQLRKEQFPNSRLIEVSSLNGMTNLAYAVTLSCGKYVFRLPTEMSKSIIDRNNEKIFTQNACEIGIDSPVILFDEYRGLKISRYIDNAVALNTKTTKSKDNIVLMVSILKKLHNSAIVKGAVFNYYDMVEQYEGVVLNNNASFYKDYFEIKQEIFAIKNKFKHEGVKLANCHNDPLPENWIRSLDRMYLIDWEYAALNDPMWDLADISIESDYSAQLDLMYLSSYFERPPTKKELYSFNANKVFIDFLWSLWGVAKASFGDQEFESYALKRYERMKKNRSLLEQS